MDATGTDYALVATTATVATISDCDTAFAAGDRLIKTKTAGEIGGTRNTTEHKYFADDTEYSLGAVSYGDLTFGMAYNSADTAGQAEVKTMFADKTARNLLVKNVDGTYVVVPVKCNGIKLGYTIDDLVMLTATLRQNGAETEVIA